MIADVVYFPDASCSFVNSTPFTVNLFNSAVEFVLKEVVAFFNSISVIPVHGLRPSNCSSLFVISNFTNVAETGAFNLYVYGVISFFSVPIFSVASTGVHGPFSVSDT